MGIVPKNSPYVLGIDLGTSNSVIACYRGGDGAEVISIDGEKTCPSVVSVRDDGEVLVGKQARARMIALPRDTVASAKRDLGTDKTYVLEHAPDREFTPVDISAEILAKLAAGAAQSEDIDLKGTPRYVVICVPANFDDAKKLATREAAEKANLEVFYLLEEPVAAAIAYAMEKERDQTILVYDLGGGTFDVSILKVMTAGDGPASFDILAKSGVERLGGDDFDECIMRLASAQLVSELGFDLMSDCEVPLNQRQLNDARQKLKAAAEDAKKLLTESETASISLTDLAPDEAGRLHSLDFSLTREQFEETIRDLILQSRGAIDNALKEASLTIDDVSRIILVGGSTRVPLVRRMITEMFQKEPYADTDPDTVVARGAAVYGASLGVPDEYKAQTEGEAERPDKEMVKNDIVTHFLGIETSGQGFSCLLEKGTPIPADGFLEAERVYTTPRDNMTDLTIRVYQSSEEVESVGAEGAKCIGEFFLSEIPARPRGQEQVVVTFAIDQQNTLKVRAVSSTSDGELKIDRS